MVNWFDKRATATGIIVKYGARAILRRATGDRDCIAFMNTESPRPRDGQLRNPVDRLVLVVADGLSVPPDAEKDHLILLDPVTAAEVESLRLIAPIGKFAPAGVVMYWELQARN
jgi:hypothetical protein